MKRILVVEDDSAIRKLVLRVLAREGYEIEAVSNGRDAIACMEDNAYDAIVLDLMMPHVSGFDVLTRLRREKPDLLKKLIVITAAAERDTREIREGDVCAIVRKPFELEELIQIVRRCAGETEPIAGIDPAGPLTQPS